MCWDREQVIQAGLALDARSGHWVLQEGKDYGSSIRLYLEEQEKVQDQRVADWLGGTLSVCLEGNSL